MVLEDIGNDQQVFEDSRTTTWDADGTFVSPGNVSCEWKCKT